MLKKFITVLGLVLLAQSAMPNNDIKSFGNFFQTVKTKQAQNINYTLPDLDKQKIKYTVTKGILDLPTYDYKKNEDPIIAIGSHSVERPAANDESNASHINYVLNITFEPLTQEQFTFLKTYFKTTSELAFVLNKKYNLSEFLPKSAQGVLNKYYITNRETVTKNSLAWFYSLSNDDRSLIVSSTANCWNAAWEYIRNSSTEYTTFFAPESVINKYFNDAKYSAEVAKLNSSQIVNTIYKNSTSLGLQPGDLILIYQKMSSMTQGNFEALSHVAIYLGGGLIFEKTNNSSANPYRISFLTSALDNLVEREANTPARASDFSDTRIVARRFNKLKLPHAKEALSFMQNDGEFIIKADIPAALKPSPAVLKSYTLVSDIGSAGNILFEYLYKILDHKLPN